MKRLALTFAFIAIAGYTGLTAALWLLQEKLLFHPMAAASPPKAPAGWTIEPVQATARDGAKLAGFLVKPPGPPAPLVIYFGGNAEEVTGWAPGAADYGPRALLLVNYRGYGASEGVPSEAAMFSDALELFDAAMKRGDVDGTRVAVVGCSLGTGVAVHVASQRSVKAVALVSPYDSIRDVAAAHYSFLPVRWVVRHPFDSASRAPLVKAPALIAVGTADTLIPPSHSKRLASLWGGPVENIAIEGADHNSVYGPKYFAALRGFLDRHL
ncbi:hypothetical protein BWI17_05685 [Betaproteobacteria bacterium GR16-43]|nr:hypothetical protein BWI17_05685 [Betaproteobacteria bacterium GR16-43]